MWVSGPSIDTKRTCVRLAVTERGCFTPRSRSTCVLNLHLHFEVLDLLHGLLLSTYGTKLITGRSSPAGITVGLGF
eukprot:SAG31_NODE_5618_length_2421_cov_15.170112_2_plen_76_part_00